MSTSSLPSFIKIHPAVPEKKSKMWKVYGRTDDGRRTDGRTDGRCAMTIAHSSLRLRWAKKDIGIFGHFMVIDFITRYSYHTYFAHISTSWHRCFGTGCIVHNGELSIFVNNSVFSALLSLKLCVLFEEGILGTPVQKDAVPPMVISNYHRWKPNSTKLICVLSNLCLLLTKVLFETPFKSFKYNTKGRRLSNYSNWFCAHIVVQGTSIRGFVKIKSMDLTNIQRKVAFAPHI